MAEAIGLVASVVQLAGTGLKLSQALYQYADGVANADRRIKDVAKEIKLTSCVIEELGNVFKQDDTLSLISKSAVATANETLEECSALFGEIEATLNKSKMGKMGRLMLPFRENKMELLRNHIDKLKSTLQLLMQVLLHAHQVASKKIDREAEARNRDEIRQLLEEKKNNTKRYEESLRNFAASDSSTEVEDDAFDLQDQISASTVEIKAIGSTVNPDSLAECMKHVQTLLKSMERLQQALANKPEGPDHSNYQQKAIESYFIVRSHLDGILLGGSNTTNVKNTVMPLREPTDTKTLTPTSDEQFCMGEEVSESEDIAVGEDDNEEGELVVETTTTLNAQLETKQSILSSCLQGGNSRKTPVSEKVLAEAGVGPGPPPVIQGNAYGSSRLDGRLSGFLPFDSRIHSSQSYSPQITERQPTSCQSTSTYSDNDPVLQEFRSPLVRPPIVGSSMCKPSKQHRTGNIAVPETASISQVMHSYQFSRDEIHGSGFGTRQGESQKDSLGGKANDTQKAAPEGSDEVDQLLREWTTCFS